MTPDSLMIFAAGLGKRMGDLTKDRPKPMIEVAGKTLIERAIEQGRDAGFTIIAANIHYLPDQLREVLERHDIAIADETETLLETGGGLRAALPLLGPGPVATLNSDAVWAGPNALGALKRKWKSDQKALLALVPADHAHAHSGQGDFSLSPDGKLSRGGTLVYTGAQIIDPGRLHEIRASAFSLNTYWDLLAEAGPIHGTVIEGQWCDVGHPEAIEVAETLLQGPSDV